MSIFAPKTSAPRAVKFGMKEGDPEEVNAVYIKPFLSLMDVSNIEKSTYTMSMSQAEAEAVQESGDTRVFMSYSPLQSIIAHLDAAVVEWSGPMFEDKGKAVPYRRGIWYDLKQDAAEWWMVKVYREILSLNAKKTEPVTQLDKTAGADPN